jgi:glutamate--cysteine ligase
VADEACEPVADAWECAARDGLDDGALHRAAQACVAAAVDRVPDALRDDVAAYAELVARGRTPGDELLERIEKDGPLTVLEEEAHAC